MKKILLSFAMSLCVFAQMAYSQQVFKRFEFGGNVGLSGYLGDLNKSDYISKEPKPSLGLLGRYHFSQRLALRGGLTFGGLSGKDANYSERAKRGFTTKSGLTELAGMLEWDFLKPKNARFSYDSTNFKINFKKRFSPYVFLGLGAAFTNPKPDFTGTAGTGDIYKQGAATDKAAGYSKTNITIPSGFGFRYDLNDNLVLNVETGWRFTGTDYLDGISKAANPSQKDRYKISNIGLTYRWDKSDKDRDGIPDEADACPTEAGPARLKGCPDTDGDGIANKDDECPTVAGLAQFNGCPDADGDGVADKNDSCPTIAGLTSLNGCPDADNDGIADKDDACPTVAGTKALNGCPDSDGDGIADKDDTCPTIAGIKAMNGCPDSDGDGIADKDDDCPTVAGLASLKGCPDSDGDGIADKDDACPTVAGTVAMKGCPEQAATNTLATAKDLQIRPILFDVNKSNIKPEYVATLDEIADFMNKNPDFKAKIVGHTDATGNAAYNQKLSERRSKTCMDYLIAKGIATSRLSFLGEGDKLPQTANSNAQNRRVEIATYR